MGIIIYIGYKMGIHDDIIKKYKEYRIVSEEQTIDTKTEYIFTIQSSHHSLVKGKYTVLGAYSPGKNIWIWGDRSHILDTNMVKRIRDIRKHILSTKPDPLILGFVKEHYKVLPSNELTDIVERLENITKKHIICNNSYGKTDYMIVDKIIYNSLSK